MGVPTSRLRTLLVAGVVLASAPAALAASNQAPRYPGSLPNHTIFEGKRWTYTVPAFVDPEGRPLTYKVKGRPAWLTFDPLTRTLTGIPPHKVASKGDAKSFGLTAVATDELGATHGEPFTLKVKNAVTHPWLMSPLPSIAVNEDGSYIYDVTSGFFVSPNGLPLSYAFSGLPQESQLIRNGVIRIYPRRADVGVRTITVTATDSANQIERAAFQLTVKAVNHRPGEGSGPFEPLVLEVVEEQPFSFVLPRERATDPDGDPLTFSLIEAPAGVQFDASNFTLSGTLATSALHQHAKIGFVDPEGESWDILVRFSVAPVNDPPRLSMEIPDVYLATDQYYSFTARYHFADEDDPYFSISYSELPDWLRVLSSFSATIVGEPPAEGGRWTLIATALDSSGVTVSDSFDIVVTPGNHAPVAQLPIRLPQARLGEAFEYVLPVNAFTDPDGDPVTLAVQVMPTWMNFDPTTRRLSGVPVWEHGDVLRFYYDLHLLATDAHGASTLHDMTGEVLVDTGTPRGFTLRGTMRAQPGTGMDTDTNDPAGNLLPGNNYSEAAQVITTKPVAISGFASAVPTPTPDARFRYFGDFADVYEVQLQAGEAVALSIADHPGGSSLLPDLDLYLERVADGQMQAFSVGTGPSERVVAPSTGVYHVVVWALNGKSTYLLNVGSADGTARLGAMVTDRSEFVLGEAIVRRRSEDRVPRTGDVQLRKNGAMASAPKLEPLAEAFTAAGKTAPDLGRWRGKPILDRLLAAKLETALQAKLLAADPGVDRVELNFIRRPLSTPNDPRFAEQWALQMVNAPTAWGTTQGSSDVTIAVIDSGVTDHPDLLPNLLPGYDFVRATANAGDGDGIDPDPSDPGTSGFHGTHVAGIAAAAIGNGEGVAGVAGGSKILPVRVLGLSGGTVYDIAQGIRFAAGLSNDSGTVRVEPVDVINLSLGGYDASSEEQEAVWAARDAGVIIVGAAGNSSVDFPLYPASYSGVISVSAVDTQRSLTDYSNHGPYIDVAAPGGDMEVDRDGDGHPDGILNTDAEIDGDVVVPIYERHSGTSMAAPHVAGVAALMRSIYPALTPARFDEELRSGRITQDLGADGAVVRNHSFGYGLIDAGKAVMRATSLVQTLPPYGSVYTEPEQLVLGHRTSSAVVKLKRDGAATIRVTSVTSSRPDVTVAPYGVDANGIGSYAVTVDRTGLVPDDYPFSIRFVTDIAGSYELEGRFEVSASVISTANTGIHHLVLVDPVTYEAVAELTVSAALGNYDFEFEEVPPGDYLLYAGTDHDADGAVCDPGEACAAYPTLSAPEVIHISDQGIDLLPFETAIQLNSDGGLAVPAVSARIPEGILLPASPPPR